jgi:SAM-dependent methyltransferase
MAQPRLELSDSRSATVFYDDRYAQGYMEEWSEEKKRRIVEVVSALPLPMRGRALDFGCGNGVLTDVLRRALPTGWDVVGTDLSAVALENARLLHPGCVFVEPGAPEVADVPFDLVFTHHVLEHVADVQATLDDLAARLAPDGGMLHILPCGNPGSFEHELCLARPDGIDRRSGNRFFFEEEGHLRRLSTDDMRELCAARGFDLEAEWYANQRAGAVAWLTLAPPEVIAELTDARYTVDPAAARRLSRLRRRLRWVRLLRLPAHVVARRIRRGIQGRRDLAVVLLGLPMYPVSKAVDAWVDHRANAEWRARKRERCGSEMFLWLRRRVATRDARNAAVDVTTRATAGAT